MTRLKLDRLKKWENKLNVCIRCGYCYEHCPIYKHTRWETDAPRAKLALVYGLIHGEVQPSDYISEKLFECFYCKRCENNCSSGVPLTEIFADARADLLDGGYDPLGTMPITDRGKCALCLACVRACKHGARSYDNKIVVDKVKCQSCGACVDACPGVGIHVEKSFGTSRKELHEEIAAFFKEGENPNAKAVILICNWSNYPGMQVARIVPAEAAPAYKVLVSMCSGRVETQLIMEAFELGAWGVLVACCPDEECDHDGNYRARARVSSLKKIFQQVGIDPGRVEIEAVAKGDQAGFQKVVDSFMKALESLGPVAARDDEVKEEEE